ncbi:Predicted DNA-binding protein, MmcQ/YjbR family [Bizionia echini]|uniref:Predicted DNA-binding protein, MmcQ/YjbR family n=1 Tax=Bizionia echini TaxID=649333 RepID=A0A1I4YSV6_9FLAO|nr:MmcQ/YjbR family DNA-binding protein [Bizionia echini]MBP93166.1 MmcQ-like protein [Flavobacteriaceae bacterium]SFN41102.1 Predicted DNA-binding protein, MmcQ/YjbR family [Bizionia echini]
MNIEQLRNYCLTKRGVTEHFPFDEDVLVFKVGNKMFLLTSLKSWEENEAAINVKCDPDYAVELRANYESVEPGYHMSKIHWNTIRLYKGELTIPLVKQFIDDSYNLIVKSLPKKIRETLQ